MLVFREPIVCRGLLRRTGLHVLIEESADVTIPCRDYRGRRGAFY